MTRRIAMISEHASPLALLGGADGGGQNVYVGQLSKHLADIGYLVDVFTRRDDASLPRVVTWSERVRIVHVKAGPPRAIPKENLLPYMEEFTNDMASFMERSGETYDLVHANFWMSGLVALRLKQLRGLPFVVTFHALGRVRRLYQGDADKFPTNRLSIEDAIFESADRVVAECPQDKEDQMLLYAADPARIRIVPCGFDPEEFAPIDKRTARERLGLDPEERIVLQLGRMVPRKGVDNAIRAVARLNRVYGVRTRLLVVGGESDTPDPAFTPEIGRLMGVAEEEGAGDRVTFVGRRGRDELKYFYSAADVFVTTPWYEPFGITPLEAMACGRPVVGAAVGGIKYSVADGETGYLVPPRDPDALAERLVRLFSNPQLLDHLGREAARRVNRLFTWRKVAYSMSEVYEEVLSERRAASPEEPHQLSVIDSSFNSAQAAMEESRRVLRGQIVAAVRVIADAFQAGNKLLVFGNGGSAADAQHFTGELVGKLKRPDRPGLPGLALNADTAFLTAWSNDIGFEDVFARQVETFGRAGDWVIGISTSGRSRNVVRAFETARRMGVGRIALLGGDGGDALPLADLAIVVPSSDTQRIQEVHILVLHLLAELVEDRIMTAGPAQQQNVGSDQVEMELELQP